MNPNFRPLNHNSIGTTHNSIGTTHNSIGMSGLTQQQVLMQQPMPTNYPIISSEQFSSLMNVSN